MKRGDVRIGAQAHIDHVHIMGNRPVKSFKNVREISRTTAVEDFQGVNFRLWSDTHNAKGIIFCGNDARHVGAVTVVIIAIAPPINKILATGKIII